MDTRREEYRVPTFPNGDSLEMICNELQRGINEVAVGNMAIAKALLETLHGRIVKTAAAYAAGVQAERERTSGLVDAGKAMREEIREHMDFIDDRIPFRSERYMNEAAAKWDASLATPSTTPNDQTTQPSTT